MKNTLIFIGIIFSVLSLHATQQSISLEDWMVFPNTRVAENGTITVTITPDSKVKNSGGTRKEIFINQKTIGEISFSAESRAENVSGEVSDVNYALFVSALHTDDTYTHRIAAPFQTGTHDWEKVDFSYTPEKPVKYLYYYLIFRNKTGTVQFRTPTVSFEGATAIKPMPNLKITDNPPPFSRLSEPEYFNAQNFALPSVKKLGEKSAGILRDAGNPQDETGKVRALANWISTTLKHPAFNPQFKRRTHDPAYRNFAHDPVLIIEYTEKFLPLDPETWPSPECSHQNDALIGLLNSIGLHARLVLITGHDVAEYFSKEFRKWVYIDATFNEMFEDREKPGIPLGILELRELVKAHGPERLRAVPCGMEPKESYLDTYPYGFEDNPVFKMHMAVFDQAEKSNNRPNLLIFGRRSGEFFRPYPRTNQRESVDFPLGLIRADSFTLRNQTARLRLAHCIPYFSHYEEMLADGTWKKLDSEYLEWNCEQPATKKFRGMDQAGWSSQELIIETTK